MHGLRLDRVVLVLALALIASTAHAASGSSLGPSLSSNALTSGPTAHTWRDQVHAGISRGLIESGATALELPVSVQAGEDDSVIGPLLADAGDLDADGTEDVYGFVYVVPRQCCAFKILAQGRSGKDGALLWSRDLGLAEYWYYEQTELAAGAPGLVLVAEDYTGGSNSQPGDGAGSRITVIALDGAGRQVWSTQQEGTVEPSDVTGSAVLTGVPDGVYLTDAVPGRAVDVLLTSRTGVLAGLPPAVPRPVAAVLTGRIVDGTDGTTVSRVRTAHVTGTDLQAFMHPTGDVTGDGRDDVAVLTEQADGTAVASTYSAADGASVWSATGLPTDEERVLFLLSLGDLTGDGKDEVRYVVGFNGTSHVLDGASGQLRYTHEGLLYRLGDVTGDGVAELGSLSQTTSRQQSVINLTAYDVSGRRVGGSTTVFPTPEDSGRVEVAFPGDTDGDGTQDVLVGTEVCCGADPEGTAQGTSLLRTKTGKAWTSPHERCQPTPLRHAAGGADLVRVASRHGQPDLIEALDGGSGRQLWTVPSSDRLRTPFCGSFASADVTVDGTADVLVNNFSGRSGALGGRDGTLLWTVEPAYVDGTD